jgi:hypothetical protein
MLVGARFACLVTVVLVATSAAAQAATVVTWNASATLIDGNGQGFDIAELDFPSFTANSLMSISGSGFYQNKGYPDRTFTMSVRLNNDWIEIYNSGKIPGSSVNLIVPLSTLETPIVFALGSISGLRLATLGDVSFAYHNVIGTEFTFDVVATPLPAALPLFGGGLGALGLLSWWRRRSLAQSAVDCCAPLESRTRDSR